MAPQRPTSPTSLLWAHQLKREHGYLLDRMQDLESASQKQDERIRSAEQAAKTPSPEEVATLTKQVRDIDAPGIHKRLEAMENGLATKFEDVQANSDALTSQVAALQKDARMSKEERKQSLSKDVALLKRIGEVEEGLKKYERALDAVGRKVNVGQMEAVKGQLDELAERVRREGGRMKLLEESIGKLDEANQELRRANEELAEALRRQEEREERRGMEQESSAAGTPNAVVSGGQRPRKSHKWNGGGADRDIVQQGSDMLERERSSSMPTLKTKAPVSALRSDSPAKRAVPIAKKPAAKKRNPVPKAPLTPGERKSHKWAGGGADRDIVAAGISIKHDGKRRRSSDLASDEPASKKPLQKVVRSGRGWFEVVERVEAESEDEALPEKLGRRKIEQLDEDRLQHDMKPAAGKRRSMFPTLRESELDLFSQNPNGRQMRTKRPTEKAARAIKEESAESGIMVSPGRARKQEAVKATTGEGGNGKQQPELAQYKTAQPRAPRRRIIQDDD